MNNFEKMKYLIDDIFLRMMFGVNDGEIDRDTKVKYDSTLSVALYLDFITKEEYVFLRECGKVAEYLSVFNFWN